MKLLGDQDRTDPVPHKPLGELEQAVMEALWEHGTLGSPEVQQALSRSLALTTVVTTLDRLHKKGLLHRERVGKGYRYSAAFSRSELEERIVRGVFADLMSDFPEAVTHLLTEGSWLPPEVHARLADRLERLRSGEEE